MEVNHIFLLSCSLEKLLLGEWFFNYSTLSPCIVLVGGSLVEWEQLFLKEIEGDRGCNFTRLELPDGQFSLLAIILGGNCPGSIYPGGNHPGRNYQGRGNYLGAIFFGGTCHRTVHKITFRKTVPKYSIYVGLLSQKMTIAFV